MSLLRGSSQAPRKRDPPLTVVLDYLTTVDGKGLEILTHTTPELAKAALIGFIYNSTIIEEGETSPGCPYVCERIEQVERFAVSIDGHGRADLIEALRASGTKTPERPNSSFEELERCRAVRTREPWSTTRS